MSHHCGRFGTFTKRCDFLKKAGAGFGLLALAQRDSRGQQMKAQDQYLKFVLWEDADALYVGYCPDLFPWGGVCHGKTEEETYRALCALVREEVEELLKAGQELHPASTRAMREAVPA